MSYRSERYNGSGCLDMTAYLALRNVCRKEQKHPGQSCQSEEARTDRQTTKKSKGA